MPEVELYTPEEMMILEMTKKLAENEYINMIDQEITMRSIIDQCKAQIPLRIDGVLKPITVACAEYNENRAAVDIRKNFVDTNSKILKGLGDVAKELGANYFFIARNIATWGASTEWTIYGGLLNTVSATPYAIITDEEITLLKEVYGGGAPEHIRTFAKRKWRVNLDIDYVDLYTNNPRIFKHHFTDLNKEERIKALHDISTVHKNKRNEELDTWLSKRFATLAKSAARDIVQRR